MFKNVLVGVDGRPGGRDAIVLARHLSDPDTKLTLAFVRTDAAAEDVAGSQEILERESAATGTDAELVDLVSYGPGRALHEQAELQGADLLVVGSCSRGALGRAMLGDDTRAALDGAPCAVAIAARGYAEQNSAIREIGVAYDGSSGSVTALEAARQLGASTGAKIRALEVVSLPLAAYAGPMAPTGAYIDEMLAEASARMAALGDVDGRAVHGLDGEELARFGDELDILLVGSRGYGPVRRMMSGSTSFYLERHARCSLLVLTRAAQTHADATGTSLTETEARVPAAR